MKFNFFIKHTAIVITIVVLFFSCKTNVKGDWRLNVIHSIEDDVSIVGSVDFLKLIEKSAIMDSEYMPDEYKGMMSMYVQNTLQSENLGFQIEGNNYFVVANDEKGLVKYIFFMADVLNEDKMAKNLKFLVGGAKDKEKYTYLTTNEGIVLGWDQSNLIGLMKGEGYTESNISSKSLLEKLLDSRSNLSNKQDGLAEFLNRKDDVNAFIYLDAYTKMASSIAGLTINNNSNTNSTGDRVVGSLNFLNGSTELNVDLKTDENTNYAIFKDSLLDEKYFNYLSNNEKLIAFFLGNLNLDALVNNPIFKQQFSDLYTQLGFLLSTFDLEVTDLSKMFTGEYALSVLDFESSLSSSEEAIFDAFGNPDDDFFDDASEEEFYNYLDNYDSQNSSFSTAFLLSIGLTDSSSVSKLIEKYNLDSLSQEIIPLNVDLSMLVKENILFISSSNNVLNTLRDKGKLSTYSHANSVKLPAYGFVNTDTNRIPDLFKKYLVNEYGNSILEIFTLLNSVEFNSTNSSAVFELSINDKNNNSLKVLIDGILSELSKNMPIEAFI